MKMYWRCLLATIFCFSLLYAYFPYAKDNSNIDENTIEEATTQENTLIVASKMRDKMGSFRDCYTDALKTNKNLKKGEIKVSFTINKKGEPYNVVIGSSQVKDKDVEDCITAIIKGMTFPVNLEGDLPVNYPLLFQK